MTARGFAENHYHISLPSLVPDKAPANLFVAGIEQTRLAKQGVCARLSACPAEICPASQREAREGSRHRAPAMGGGAVPGTAAPPQPLGTTFQHRAMFYPRGVAGTKMPVAKPQDARPSPGSLSPTCVPTGTRGTWGCPGHPISCRPSQLRPRPPSCRMLSQGSRGNSAAVKTQSQGSRSRLLQTVLVEH